MSTGPFYFLGYAVLNGKKQNLSIDFTDYADLILKNRCNLYNLWMNPARNVGAFFSKLA